MGRHSSSGTYRFGYGVIIKQPKDPSWPIMLKRLQSFDYDQTLFAMAARAAPKSDLDDERIPEQITKSAKKTMQPVLISFRDTKQMSEEEKKIKHNDHEKDMHNYRTEIDNLMWEACKKILGEDTKVCMEILTAASGYEYEYYDKFAKPVMFLEAVQCTSGKLYEPTTHVEEVNIPSIENPEDVTKDISLVLKALGLEGDRPEPGWHLAVTNTCEPDS